MSDRPRPPAGAFLRELRQRATARLAGHDLALLTAALTFYAAIAVLPLLIIAVAGASALVGDERVQALGSSLAALAPSELGFADGVRQLLRTGSEVGPLALAAALVPATTYGEGLVRAFARLAGADTPRKGLRGRVLSAALLAVLPLLVLLGLGAVAVLPSLLVGGEAGSAGFWGYYLSFLVTWAASTALLAVTYRTFTPMRLRPSAMAWAAAATGSFLAGMSLGWVVVLRFGVQVGQAYGGSEAIGSAVLFVVYLYLVQLTCLLGYLLAMALTDVRSGLRR